MKTIIVEDNPGAINVLKSFLKDYPDLALCGVAQTLQAAKEIILQEQPDIWLLDIRLHDKLVFTLLKELPPDTVRRATIVFLTAYYEPEYIHEALRVAALDYLIKPIDADQLYAVLDKAKARLTENNVLDRIIKLESAIRVMDTRVFHQRIPVHRVNGEIEYMDKHDVILIATEDEITRVRTVDGRQTGSTKSLKFYQDLLYDDRTFLRISKQILLNLEYLKSFNPRIDTATLLDGTQVHVSRRKSVQLMELFEGR